MGNSKWILTEKERPTLDSEVEVSEDGITVEDEQLYLEKRTCMLAGTAGGHGYFGEGFATNGEFGDYGLICNDPKYWRYIK